MLPRADHISRAAMQLSNCGIEKVIVPPGWIVTDFFQGFQSGTWPIDLGNHDGAVQQVDRRWMNCQQSVVETKNRRPVRFGIRLRRAVLAGNRSFQMKGGYDGPVRRIGEKLLRPANQAPIPSRAI